MFRFMIKFLKILAIACLIGVSLRVIEVLFLKQQAKDLAISNITNEVQNEEILQVANNEEKIVEEKEENITNQQVEKNTVAATKKEAVVENSKKEESAKVEKQETIKTQTKNEDKQEEKQQVITKQTIPETTKQEVIETKQETPIQKEKVETKTEEKYTEVEVNIAEKKECAGNNHGMEVGNSGKWFNTKDEAIATYKAEIKIWGDKWTDKDNPISDEDYYKNCPYGYEVWTCMYCGKWTLNYYYDN